MRPGGVQHDLLRHVEAFVEGRTSSISSSASLVLALHHARRLRARAATAACRRAAPRALREFRTRSPSAIRFRPAPRLATRGPARLIEQRRIDQQRIAPPTHASSARTRRCETPPRPAGSGPADCRATACPTRRARCNARARNAPRRRSAAAIRTVPHIRCRGARRWWAARHRRPDRAIGSGRSHRP